MTAKELYQEIPELYGKRQAWISDLAQTLQISHREANLLTYAYGYRRGKLTHAVSETAFVNNPSVKYFLEKFNN